MGGGGNIVISMSKWKMDDRISNIKKKKVCNTFRRLNSNVLKTLSVCHRQDNSLY